VTVARFLEGLRQVNGIIAGTTGMHWAKFLAFNALGAALWVTAWTSVGYLSGNHISMIYNTAKQYELYLAIGVGALLIAHSAQRIYRSRQQRAARHHHR